MANEKNDHAAPAADSTDGLNADSSERAAAPRRSALAVAGIAVGSVALALGLVGGGVAIGVNLPDAGAPVGVHDRADGGARPPGGGNPGGEMPGAEMPGGEKPRPGGHGPNMMGGPGDAQHRNGPATDQFQPNPGGPTDEQPTDQTTEQPAEPTP